MEILESVIDRSYKIHSTFNFRGDYLDERSVEWISSGAIFMSSMLRSHSFRAMAGSEAWLYRGTRSQSLEETMSVSAEGLLHIHKHAQHYGQTIGEAGTYPIKCIICVFFNLIRIG